MNKENLRAIEALRRKYASDEDAMAGIEKSA